MLHETASIEEREFHRISEDFPAGLPVFSLVWSECEKTVNFSKARLWASPDDDDARRFTGFPINMSSAVLENLQYIVST